MKSIQVLIKIMHVSLIAIVQIMKDHMIAHVKSDMMVIQRNDVLTLMNVEEWF